MEKKTAAPKKSPAAKKTAAKPAAPAPAVEPAPVIEPAPAIEYRVGNPAHLIRLFDRAAAVVALNAGNRVNLMLNGKEYWVPAKAGEDGLKNFEIALERSFSGNES